MLNLKTLLAFVVPLHISIHFGSLKGFIVCQITYDWYETFEEDGMTINCREGCEKC